MHRFRKKNSASRWLQSGNSGETGSLRQTVPGLLVILSFLFIKFLQNLAGGIGVQCVAGKQRGRNAKTLRLPERADFSISRGGR